MIKDKVMKHKAKSNKDIGSSEIEMASENEIKMEKEYLLNEEIDAHEIADDFSDPSTIIVDRDEEDRDVEEFQKTSNMRLLEKLYRNRIPTLKSWANKHYYPGLTLSIEDLFEELSFVFVKAVEKYERKKGNFNNCLFTFLLNRLKNIKSSKHAKKRVSDKYDGPISGMILSLDYCYNDKDGSEITLKDIISSPESSEKSYIHKNASFEETINVLSANNPQLREFLVKISEGVSLTSLIKQYKTKQGKIKIDKQQTKSLSKKRSRKLVSEIIRAQDCFVQDFRLVKYSLDNTSNLTYEIELKSTKETENIMRSLRELKRNKHMYMDKIKGLT